jgi:hypothetical protein
MYVFFLHVKRFNAVRQIVALQQAILSSRTFIHCYNANIGCMLPKKALRKSKSSCTWEPRFSILLLANAGQCFLAEAAAYMFVEGRNMGLQQNACLERQG